jgi:transposase-like protein
MGQEECHGNAQEVLSGVQTRNRPGGENPTTVNESGRPRSRHQPEPADPLVPGIGRRGAKVFPGNGKPRDEEIANLKRELAQTRKERDFLQEAAAFFASVSK